MSPALEPRAEPLAAELARLIAAEGTFRERLEDLLARLPESQADALMMLSKESRGAWALLLESGGGTAVFCGNALSGTPVALATLGFRVVVVDRSAARLGFAHARAAELVAGTTVCVLAGTGARLPFGDAAANVVIVEDGIPSIATGWGFDLDEVRRVASTEVLVTADNRLGYKRSTGRRGRFRRAPLGLAREVLAPSRGERALPGTRRAVAGPWPRAEALALYPHAREFSHVVALERELPRLTIGPRERKNRLKMMGSRLGLFRWLTPSFAIRAPRPEPTRDFDRVRMERILDALAEATGEPRPAADIVVATRSNDALVHTARPGADPGDPAGRWTIHVPLQPSKRRMVRIHHGWLTRFHASHGGGSTRAIPVPEPLFLGHLDGIEMAVERRLGGLNGTDVTGDIARTGAMFADAARHMATLVEPSPAAFDATLFRELLELRTARVAGLVRTQATRRRIERMLDALRERLVGSTLRLAAYHADLRSKHVQLDETGRVIGYLDWGASEERFLPLVDLMQLIVHQRKQETGSTFGAAWRATARPGGRRAHENEALERYASDAALDAELVDLFFDAYPLFVAGMAERNWDYSRPDWVARQFELF